MQEKNTQHEDVEHGPAPSQSNKIPRYRGLGLGQQGSFRDYSKVFAESIHEIAQQNGVWENGMSPNDLVANLHLLISYSLETMVDDVNNGKPVMHKDFTGHSTTEINLAAVVLNIFDASAAMGFNLPDAMLEIYKKRLADLNANIDEHNRLVDNPQ